MRTIKYPIMFISIFSIFICIIFAQEDRNIREQGQFEEYRRKIDAISINWGNSYYISNWEVYIKRLQSYKTNGIISEDEYYNKLNEIIKLIEKPIYIEYMLTTNFELHLPNMESHFRFIELQYIFQEGIISEYEYNIYSLKLRNYRYRINEVENIILK